MFLGVIINYYGVFLDVGSYFIGKRKKKYHYIFYFIFHTGNTGTSDVLISLFGASIAKFTNSEIYENYASNMG